MRGVALFAVSLLAGCTIYEGSPRSHAPPAPPPPGAPPGAPIAPGAPPPPAVASGGITGAWLGAVHPEGKALPCPLEMEFLPDGTVEMNYVSDDSPQEMCAFVRVPYRVQGSHVYIGPGARPIFACLYALNGNELAIACEDRPTPPSDLRESFRLQRIGVREGGGLAAIAGGWRGSLTGGAVWHVQPNGSFGPPIGPGNVVVKDASHLELRSATLFDLCLYRVTDRRWTLACQPAAQGYPASFAGPMVLVLTRA